MTNTSPIAQLVKRYSDLGLSIIPVDQVPGDIEASKKASVRWKPYQTKRADSNQLESWFNGTPRNLALIGGRVSGNVLWLDFDDPEAYRQWAAEYPEIADKAPVQETGKGFHVGVKTSGPTPGNKDLYYNNAYIGETRGEGGYIIAEPSVHGSGRLYEWIRPPWSAEFPIIDDLADIGLSTTATPAAAARPGETTAPGDRHPKTQATIDTMLGRLAQATEGQRNTTLNEAAYTFGGLIAAGHLSEIEAERMLSDTALAIGLDERETAATVRSGLSAGLSAPIAVTDSETPGRRAAATAERNAAQRTQAGPPQDAPDLPKVQVNGRHHRDISEDAYQSLLAANNPPCIFVRSGKLTRITLDEDSRPATEAISSEALKYHLDRVANFYTLRNKQDGDTIETDSSIPMAVVKDIESYPEWPELPPLSNIVTYPTFLADGTLHDQAGYNPKTRLFYYKNGLTLGDCNPTGDNIVRAKRLIEELLQDFPFVDNASKTNAIALLLLPFVRPLIGGNTPFHLFDAPSHGTGKSLLAKAIMTIAAPNGCKTMTAPTTEEEWEKKIVTALMGAPSHIMIDNIPDTLQSATLAAVLTTDYYTSRVLGLLKEITVQVRNIWIGTGNNTTAQGELARRTVWIRLDSKLEKPWERSEFKHKDLLSWVSDKRDELITAALTLINLWFVADCPKSDLTLGSYEQWVKIIGGILETAGYTDFLGNANEMYDRSAADRQPWVNFVEQWYEAYGYKEVGTKQLFTIASETDPRPATATAPAEPPMGDNLLGEFVTGNTERARQIKVGTLLKQNAFKVFGGYRIVEAGTRNRLAQYKLEPATKLF